MFFLREEAQKQLNRFGESRTPFLFFTDFLGDKVWISLLDEIDPNQIQYEFQNKQPVDHTQTSKLALEKFPVSLEQYRKAFDSVQSEIRYGNSFLVNLTLKTKILVPLSLKEIYDRSIAKYKLWYADSFVVFSPETFIKIRGNSIYSYPMKGTIDASLDGAEHKILHDPKEKAEHITIVDLIRNDLSHIASHVRVSRFRYLDLIQTSEKSLYQVSSEITGRLPDSWKANLGDLLYKLLPAGSISGAPKPKTIEIIQANETYERGMYTGICGLFDGQNLDSFVMIRFIEQEDDGQLYYKSGGGITAFSKVDSEYQEVIDKIYVPIY